MGGGGEGLEQGEASEDEQWGLEEDDGESEGVEGNTAADAHADACFACHVHFRTFLPLCLPAPMPKPMADAS